MNTATGRRISQAVLEDGDMRVSVLSYGATTQGWWYKGIPLILGYDDPNDYITDRNYMGAIVGRVANRIGGAKFDMDDARFELDANEGPNTLHGGRAGLSHRNWDLEQLLANKVVLRLTSLEGECGFPGTVQFEVHVSLEYPRLVYEFHAKPDRPTPISMAQHNYYSLGSTSGISGHQLKLAADRLLSVKGQGIPLGPIAKAAEQGLDFTSSTAIKTTDIDNFFVFNRERSSAHPVAELTAPSGLKMRLWSDQDGAQVYTGAHLTGMFSKRAGMCIEPSGYPNALNVPAFPSILCSPDLPYRQSLILEITEGER